MTQDRLNQEIEFRKNDPLMKRITELELDLQKAIKRAFYEVQEDGKVEFSEDQQVDLNAGDVMFAIVEVPDEDNEGLTAHLVVLTQMEDGEEWNININELDAEQLKHVYVALKMN